MDRRAPADADLAAVRMTRERQLDARRRGLEEEVGVMTQQDRRLALAPPRERAGDARLALREVIDAAEPERCPAMLDAHAAIHQHRDAVVREERAPKADVRPPEVIVIAGHGEHAVARRQLGERAAEQQQLTFAGVDQVPTEQHEVGLRGGDAPKDRGEVGLVHEAARVDVRDERDAQPIETLGSRQVQVETRHRQRPLDPGMQPPRAGQPIEQPVDGGAGPREPAPQRRPLAGQQTDRRRRLLGAGIRHAGERTAGSRLVFCSRLNSVRTLIPSSSAVRLRFPPQCASARSTSSRSTSASFLPTSAA